MRAVVSRVSRASCRVEGTVTGEVQKGYLVLLGVGESDTPEAAERLGDKVCNLRVFEDENGKMNRNLAQVGGGLLIISQFTLYADVSSRRPGFSHAAKPELAKPLYDHFCDYCQAKGFAVGRGVFGAHMEIEAAHDGPVTILFET